MKSFSEKEINIYVGLSEMQRKWYKSVLAKDVDAVNGGVSSDNMIKLSLIDDQG